MKKMKLITVAALSLAALVSASTAASAASISDLILGFEVTDGNGQGATVDLEFDLGSAPAITNTSILTQDISGALTSTYGSNWATRGDIVWGIAGDLSDGTTSNAFDLTSQQKVRTASSSNLAAAFGQIGGLSSGINSVSSTSTANVSTTQSTSWKAERTVSIVDFNNPGETGTAESETTSTTGSIDLYQFNPDPARTPGFASDLGTASLSNAGVFTFTGSAAAAVPEPSAYALGICAAVLFVVLRRRNKIA